MKFGLLFCFVVACASLYSFVSANAFRKILIDSVLDFRKYAEDKLIASGEPFSPSPEYPYFNFIPQYLTRFPASGKSVQWESKCFSKNIGSVSKSDDGSQLIITVKSSGAMADSKVDGPVRCTDAYFAMTTSAFKDFRISTSLKPSPIVTTEILVDIPADVTESETWDFSTKGLRLFKFLTNATTSLSNVLRTVDLFIPEMIPNVPTSVAENNIDFLKKYAAKSISLRDNSLNIPPDEKLVSSGDFFGLMRFDGLNPMLAWAMGSTTGHTTTALWIDGELYVCESTTDSAYWPTDHIQKTPYRTWLKQVQDADFQVVWAPLNAEARSKYNETAAVEFFKSVEGLDYGYKTMLYGWIDTVKDNFPCIPPTYDLASGCLQWELLETLLAVVDRKINQIGELIWNSGIAMRLGVSDKLRTSDLYKIAGDRGLAVTDIMTIPEKDTWLYNTTLYDEPAVGKAMVCCVFVCNMWKEAGVFGSMSSDINCGEQTNWDDYVLTILEPTYQQIVGTYSLELNDYNSKSPYPHMADHCPSLPVAYSKPADC